MSVHRWHIAVPARLVPRRLLARDLVPHRLVPFVVCAVLAATLVAVVVATSPPLGIAAAGLVVILALTLTEPATLPVLALPAVIVVERVGGGGPDGGGVNLSVSDLVLFAAFWAALLLRTHPPSRELRGLLWCSAFYQASTFFTVLVNPYTANVVEWFHAWLLVSGALLVGWSIGRAGRGQVALGLFLWAAAVCAVAAIVQALGDLAASGTWSPVYLERPLDMHKNLLGAVLATAALVVYQRPAWLGWSTLWTVPAFGLFAAGLLVSQSRQAILGLAVVMVVVVLRREPGRPRRSPVVLVVIAAAVALVWSTTSEQLTDGNEFNSANQRLAWYADSVRLWQDQPFFGAGLRWWTTGRTSYGFQPPNAELEVLTSAGIVGLVGFLVMFTGILVVLWRMHPAYGTLAFCAVLGRFVQGQLDLFWVAAQVPMPFLVAGICVGALARARVEPDARGPLGAHHDALARS